MKRIVYTVAIGTPKYAECALGLSRSLRLIGDTTKRVLVTDLQGYPWEQSFDEVLTINPIPSPIQGFVGRSSVLRWIYFFKLMALDNTDADQVLFIDADSLAFKRLDPVFDYCSGRGLVVSGRLISEGNWYGDVKSHCRRHGLSALPQFNGGFIYYERTDECQDFIRTVLGLAATDDTFSLYRDSVPDEPYVSLAMALTGNGHLAPDEMDWSNTAVGLIGRLNMNVLRNECAFVCRRYDVRFVQPYVFHAARYINFLVYWRQLDALARLEHIEHSSQYGHMPPLQKMRRSVEKRYLKYIAKKL